MVHPRLGDDLFIRKQRILFRAGVVVCRLRAELTVFRTASALSVDDCADVKLLRAEFTADLIRTLTQLFKRLFIQIHYFFFGDLLTI